MLVFQCLDEFLAHAVGRAQLQFLLLVIELVDRSGFGAGEFDRPRHDGRQHCCHVERRVDRLADLTEGLQFLDRACEFAGALTQLLEQSGVLNCYDSLIGEVLNEVYLLAGERTHFLAINYDCTDERIFLQHRNGEKGPRAGHFDERNKPRGSCVSGFIPDVGDVLQLVRRYKPSKSIIIPPRDHCLAASLCPALHRGESGGKPKRTAIVKQQTAEFRLANARGVRQHRRKHRLQFTRRCTDDLQYLRGCRLLLQRFGQVICALA